MLAELGGVATRAQLLALRPREEVERARECGAVVVLGRGRYALPATESAAATAHALTAVLSHRHAAVHHGWAVKLLPPRPDVIVPRNRRLSAEQARAATVHRSSLLDEDVSHRGGLRLTSMDRTLADCLRLPFDEALAVADSALRTGVSPGRLSVIARDLQGPGARRARRVASLATRKSAGPFESVLRAIAADVEGLALHPQLALWDADRFLARPDLVDMDHRIVVEADSFAWHGDRAALARDCRRYNELTVRGWLVLRFAYEQVMGEPGWVRSMLESAVFERTERAESAC